MAPRAAATGPSDPIPPDLPDELDALADAPADLRGAELRACRLRGLALAGGTAHDLHVIESRLDDADLAGAQVRGVRLRDAYVAGGSWANADAGSADMRRVELRDVRLTGMTLAGCALTDVTFAGCRLDLANVRFGQLVRVRFESCVMAEIDLQDAALESVVLSDCDLSGARLADATFTNSAIRRCRLAGLVNPERLRGVRMTVADALGAVDMVAAAAGIELEPADGGA
jgi:uncharacterized protein YjbI with pentapeptide repeats